MEYKEVKGMVFRNLFFTGLFVFGLGLIGAKEVASINEVLFFLLGYPLFFVGLIGLVVMLNKIKKMTLEKEEINYVDVEVPLMFGRTFSAAAGLSIGLTISDILASFSSMFFVLLWLVSVFGGLIGLMVVHQKLKKKLE